MQMEFNKGLSDSVVRAACIVELQEEKELEALKADLYIKAVTSLKNAAVSDMVDARTSVILASQIATEVRVCRNCMLLCGAFAHQSHTRACNDVAHVAMPAWAQYSSWRTVCHFAKVAVALCDSNKLSEFLSCWLTGCSDAERVYVQITSSLAAMTAVHHLPEGDGAALYTEALELPMEYQQVVRQLLLRRFPDVRCQCPHCRL